MAEIYINEDRRFHTKEIRNSKRGSNKRKRKKRIGNRKFILIIGIVLILFSIIFLILPKLGVYAYFFDRGEYDESLKDSTEQIREISELTPHTQKLCKEFLIRCENEGLPVIITETYRSQKRQDELFRQGRETDGPVVTWTKNSRHTKRRAFDIAKRGPDPYGDEEFFRKCAEIGKEVGLNPGYFWDDYQDKPHYELDAWWLP